MYFANITKDRIKQACKNKHINASKMLADCELGANAIQQINDTKGMASFSLAKIADYLDCSVDYLLGRTDNPDSHKSKTKNYTLPPLEIAAYGAEETKGTYTTPTEDIT